MPQTRFLLRLVAPWLLLIVLLPGCSQPAPPPQEAAPDAAFHFEPEPPPTYVFNGGVRVATVNTEFMFDGMGDEGQASFPHQGDPEKARAHRDRVGEIVRMIDADVIMMEEVEDGSVMQKLVDESLADAGYTVHFVQGNDRFTGQDVGLLSRVPIEKIGRLDERVNVGASTDTYGVSKNMYARLMLGTVPTTIVGLHFLARPDDPGRKDRREAQAEVIRRFIAKEIDDGRAVIVLGDFNDFDDATLDIGGNQPITDVLARIKSAGSGDEDDLRNVIAEVPQSQRFTSHYDRNDNDVVDVGEFSAIDHILLSPDLYRRVREVFYVHAHDPTVYTDHFPIVVNLDVR
ncbi:MAG TPA: endonuclease/exonuclease/phosphatase family protein [Rhodothermales bacterium]|nr:endonuclease/exonuclease/phosphatase family protein [Rhodothermales bacterium]